ncbi:3-methyl-2-oxobutanoate hydroxymethyltransferase [Legionella worsleiensis]|uniref:3-methyl-2-oxobutanoate hydroxymethyltransferase n=1 Tax=Legionella worsleiensis TaxID=45076 RepID=A0A0W1AFA0_9GAMM|nr:3-methyl-2-oxobutanoate hydroxymethyltransferase [Legionella worsleiensis]KTD80021.1 3-methyl-2-oxobutanoate hydroxymethyltransferase [Legionella worsleiensis]STY32493.1 3-methyl-2-oxobutanoate hydroxymethyltransferase [Legionella worsleiensis]
MKIHDFKIKKQTGKKIAMLTCYDYPSARIIGESSIDCVLVGDSVAMTVHGYDTTVMATIEMMELHTKAVARGLNHQFLITDLPFLSHKRSISETVSEVHRLLQAGAHAIKIEGADEDTCNTISYLVKAGIPVMGHIGLTPQSIHQLGGFKVQGKNQEQAERLLQQAYALEQSGCFALVIECVPQTLAKTITDSLCIPTIGIGAGLDTDGQVLVWHDMLGLQSTFTPKFAKKYTQGKDLFLEAIDAYAQQVQQAHFPSPEYSF